MSNYNKATNFAVKDTLTSGDPDKVVSGAEIDNEFNSIASAVTSKADKVAAATTDNFAALDANGNLKDSGSSKSSIESFIQTEVSDQKYKDSDALDLFNVTGSAPVYACRAWVKFSGTGTVSINDSGNISSVTDLGTGQYRISFASSLPDNNFAAVATVKGNSSDQSESTQVTDYFTGSFKLEVSWDGSAGDTYQYQDANIVSAAVFR